MEEARQAAEQGAEREQLARERAEQLEAAYQARIRAAGAAGRPALQAGGTRLLAWFLVRLAFQDYQYDDGFVRGVLRLDETTDGAAERVAGAGPGRQGRRRPAPGGRGDRRRARRGVAERPDEPDFTSPSSLSTTTSSPRPRPTSPRSSSWPNLAPATPRTPGPRRRRRLLAWPSLSFAGRGSPGLGRATPFAVPWR